MAEQDPGPPAEQASTKPGPGGCLILLIIVVIVGLVIAAFVFNARAGGEIVLRMPLDGTPRSQSFVLDKDSRVEVWTDLEVTHRGISYQLGADQLPRVVEYVIRIEREGKQVQALRCNPFNSNFAKSSFTGEIDGVNGRSYDGRIKSCVFKAPSGKYDVRASREWIGDPDPRFVFKKTVLLLRASDSD